MGTYKFRAEVMADVGRLLEQIAADRVVITSGPPGLSDVEVTITGPCDFGAEGWLDLDGLRRRMSRVVDGHVMVETVQPEHLYTGERVRQDPSCYFGG